MANSHDEQKIKDWEEEENTSFKSAFFNSIIFVGGGLSFFWVLLFIIFTIRS